jgi:hypothetical protein
MKIYLHFAFRDLKEAKDFFNKVNGKVIFEEETFKSD